MWPSALIGAICLLWCAPAFAQGGPLAPAKLAQIVELSRGAEVGTLSRLLLRDGTLLEDGARLIEVLEAGRSSEASIEAIQAANRVEQMLRANPELETFIAATRQARSFLAAGPPSSLTLTEACLSGSAVGHPALANITEQITMAALEAQSPLKTGALIVLPNGTPFWLGPRDIATTRLVSKREAELVVTRFTAPGVPRQPPVTVRFAVDPKQTNGLTTWVPLTDELGVSEMHYGTEPTLGQRIRGRARRWGMRVLTYGGTLTAGLVASSVITAVVDSGDEEDTGASPDAGERAQPLDDGEAVEEYKRKRRLRDATLRALEK